MAIMMSSTTGTAQGQLALLVVVVKWPYTKSVIHVRFLPL